MLLPMLLLKISSEVLVLKVCWRDHGDEDKTALKVSSGFLAINNLFEESMGEATSPVYLGGPAQSLGDRLT